MAKEICEFESVFDKSDVFSDGNLKLRFEAPYSEISNVIQTVMVVDDFFEVKIFEELDEEALIEIPRNIFWKLQIYKDGNAKFEFKCDPKTFDTNKLTNIIEENVRIKVAKNE
ncbi:MAG: hypothetical protein ACQEQF_00135 [Bacillota bacterium]